MFGVELPKQAAAAQAGVAGITAEAQAAAKAAASIKFPSVPDFSRGGGGNGSVPDFSGGGGGNGPDIPSFAHGGFVPRPTLAVVGDAPGGEFIIPKRQGEGADVGGNSVTFVISPTITIPPGTPEAQAAAISDGLVRALKSDHDVRREIDRITNG